MKLFDEYETCRVHTEDLKRKWMDVLDDVTQDPVAFRALYTTAMKRMKKLELYVGTWIQSGKPLH